MVGAHRPLVASESGQFKSITAKRINKLRDMNGTAVWQRDYYERIIRDDGELENVRRYIAENPRRWQAQD